MIDFIMGTVVLWTLIGCALVACLVLWVLVATFLVAVVFDFWDFIRGGD